MARMQIMDTTIRDGQQSPWATRMQIGGMLPILPKTDKAGCWAIEVRDGTAFDSCLRFLDENPWERLRIAADEVMARARRALNDSHIEGIATTIPFHLRVLDNERFRSGDFTTDFIETQMGDLL